MEYQLPLIARKEIAEETMEFTFDLAGNDYQYKAGQNADYTLIDPPYTDDEGNTRTFSYVSTPDEKVIRIATRMRDTAFKNSLKEMPFGTKVSVKEPMGRFYLHQDTSKPAVILAGGIGITPFISMITDALKRQTGHTIYLFYSNKDLPGTAYFNELQNLEGEHTNFHFIPTFTDEPPPGWQGETGRISPALIQKHVDNLEKVVVYTAGPPMMVKTMVELAEGLTIPEEYIRSEDFAGY